MNVSNTHDAEVAHVTSSGSHHNTVTVRPTNCENFDSILSTGDEDGHKEEVNVGQSGAGQD